MRVAAVQMQSGSDKSSNLAQAHELLLQALDRNVDLVAFPENFALFTDQAEVWEQGSETLKGVLTETLQEWAAEYGVWILGGTIPLKAKGKSGKVTNTSLLVSPDGEVMARYDKIHLFDSDLPGLAPIRESDDIEAGKKPVCAELPIGKAGLAVCYDIRFPELFRKYAQLGAHVVFIPSAFIAQTGKAHWDVLTRARAIENQAYVIAPAQWGAPFPGRETYGHTRIVDPWGRVIAERPAGTGVVWADLSVERIEQVRAELPALKHRVLK
jgi:predicted amidohydrolase